MFGNLRVNEKVLINIKDKIIPDFDYLLKKIYALKTNEDK